MLDPELDDDLPDEVSWDDWPELLGRLLGEAFRQLRRGSFEDLDEAPAENARIVAAYQETIDPERESSGAAFDATVIAAGHFRDVLTSLNEIDDASPDGDRFDAESKRLLPVVVQLLKVTELACGLAAYRSLLTAFPGQNFGRTIPEHVNEARAALKVLEQTAMDLIPDE
ncbi:hypothetical protein E1264_09615 [Actinomadura sp. KC216]|uniref:hypothetical protein n=1 Tax=Actinomadura sp. KC216 TaxID=2530370 RepID=UPI00105162C7|nr:hypothetical protein [Actinomadura sp. KC216]TDB89032.1 hypothetical protein E1264_09615 [Actinomadura sp. KC216]